MAKITMKGVDYFKEHKKLINLLLTSSKKLEKEAKKQITEVKQQKQALARRKRK